ncbi:MAG TPA: hypothetical protein VF338_07230 [Leptolinea sp.]
MGKKKTYWIIGIGCCTVICCILLFLGYFFFSGTSKYFLADKEELTDIKINLTYPEKVKIGETFDLGIQISNLKSQPQFLDSIDLYTVYLKGFHLNGSEPPFIKSRVIYPDTKAEYTTYAFEQNIDGKSSETIRFQLKAEKPGRVTGLVFVCVNAGTLCNNYLIETTVE